MRDLKLGIYCHPDAVVSTPDFAKRLVEEAGVDYFIVRSGYDFTWPDSLEKAVQIVRDLPVHLQFMTGAFWGGRPQVKVDLPYRSNESMSPIDLPGSSSDAEFAAKYAKLCKTFKPDSFMVTHGRYRHPAYLDSVFDEGADVPEYQARMTAAGIPRAEVQAARASWEKAMGALKKEDLLQATEKGMIEFLCNLSQSDAFQRLIAFRCDTVHNSIMTFRNAVKECGVSFGANGYSPTAALICGQDYEKSYAETVDFLQPLLCYMEWHRYMPIASWARYIKEFTKVDEPTAIEAAKNVFYLGGTVCPDSIEELDTCVEGTNESVYSITSREIQLCAPYLSKPYMLQPVLRGKQWDWAVTDRLVEEAKALGIQTIIFGGCEYLTKGPSPVIQSASPTASWS
ncbi:MAG: hypothetical protein FWH28_07275 [Clostridiales bacterium]|nr:hypothetical protein [Clostridiales bacterium]